jgi:hypothetical protein
VPTDAQRKLVAQLIGLHVTWSEIQQLVIHPKTGEPISRKTLAKYFRRELAAGSAMLKQLAASKYFQALEAGESWALRMAMRNASAGSSKAPRRCQRKCSAPRSTSRPCA